ncbi:MAG: hypothetical protein QOF09_4267 [Alphaproteobacteria bacterium]|jgi:hypothetical protein|nr:hypothetical protein [Alphaproteobacteria bacterium]
MRLALAILFVATAIGPVGGQEKPKASDEILRQRILLQERFNKGWDVQIESWQARVEGRCRAEAKKRYSAIRFKKRRMFVENCIKQARH